MKIYKDEEVPVTYEEFLNELKGNLQYMKDGGTSYRIETAEMALMIAEKVNDIESFHDRAVSYETVSKYLPEADDDCLKDVSKALNVIMRHLHLKKNLSDEVRKRREKRKPLSLVVVSDKKDTHKK